MCGDPTKRFSTRVDDYVKYRPGYPSQLAAYLSTQCELKPQTVVADIGSGTGILTRVLLEQGCLVYGVEPNAAMRSAGELFLAEYSNFVSTDGKAEETCLPDQSVDMIVAGQAFHWFNTADTRCEWLRILKPRGWVALIWNQRPQTGSPFLSAYEDLLNTFATDYNSTNHRRIGLQEIEGFFSAPIAVHTFYNAQVLDLHGLRGRLLSSSYTPGPGQPGHAPLMEALEGIFQQYQQDGYVTIPYDCMVYSGRLGL